MRLRPIAKSGAFYCSALTGSCSISNGKIPPSPCWQNRRSALRRQSENSPSSRCFRARRFRHETRSAAAHDHLFTDFCVGARCSAVANGWARHSTRARPGAAAASGGSDAAATLLLLHARGGLQRRSPSRFDRSGHRHGGSHFQTRPRDRARSWRRYFAAARSLSVVGKPLAVGDFNGDGHADVVITGMSILAGRGDGTFRAARAIDPPIAVPGDEDFSPLALAADFNGDGTLERGRPRRRQRLHLPGTWRSHIQPACGAAPERRRPGDRARRLESRRPTGHRGNHDQPARGRLPESGRPRVLGRCSP